MNSMSPSRPGRADVSRREFLGAAAGLALGAGLAAQEAGERPAGEEPFRGERVHELAVAADRQAVLIAPPLYLRDLPAEALFQERRRIVRVGEHHRPCAPPQHPFIRGEQPPRCSQPATVRAACSPAVAMICFAALSVSDFFSVTWA